MKTLNKASHLSKADQLTAKKSSLLLGGMKFGKASTIGMKIYGKTISVPKVAIRVFMGALDSMAKGQPVAVVPLNDEISTQEAAELLNVSRPFVAKLLDEGTIPSRKVGTHRRARASDVLAYKQKTDAVRSKALDELVAQAQELELGY